MSLIDKAKGYKCTPAILVMLVLGGLMAIYGVVLRIVCGRKAVQCDLLNVRVFHWGEACCSGWPISHFTLFLVLGVFFPDCWLPILTLGVLWEVLEFLPGFIGGAKHAPVRNDGKYQYTDDWWQANIYDIFFNAVGFFVGYAINRAWRKIQEKRKKDKDKEKYKEKPACAWC